MGFILFKRNMQKHFSDMHPSKTDIFVAFYYYNSKNSHEKYFNFLNIKVGMNLSDLNF